MSSHAPEKPATPLNNADLEVASNTPSVDAPRCHLASRGRHLAELSTVDGESSVGYESEEPNNDGDITPPAGRLQETIENGLRNNTMELRLCSEGEGGTYFVTTTDDGKSPSKRVAVFKPALQEIGCARNPKGHTESDRAGYVAGEGYKHEVLAYQLDHGHFAGVPETIEITVGKEVGALQRFIGGMRESWDCMPMQFPVSHVHRIGIFDVRVLNSDRHGGNILYSESDRTLVPIDHSYILPSEYADPEFEWMFWPQAKQPFSADECEYIMGLDADKDEALVTKVLGEGAGEIIAVTTRVLQHACQNKYTLQDIASFCRRPTLTDPSPLEVVMAEARSSLDDGGALQWDLVHNLLCKYLPPQNVST